MALYLVSYDISEKDHDYQNLWDFLEKHKAKRLLYSEWAIPWANDSTALKLTNAVLEHVMAGDNILVCELFDNNPTVAWRGLKITDDDFRGMLTEYARTSC